MCDSTLDNLSWPEPKSSSKLNIGFIAIRIYAGDTLMALEAIEELKYALTVDTPSDTLIGDFSLLFEALSYRLEQTAEALPEDITPYGSSDDLSPELQLFESIISVCLIIFSSSTISVHTSDDPWRRLLECVTDLIIRRDDQIYTILAVHMIRLADRDMVYRVLIRMLRYSVMIQSPYDRPSDHLIHFIGLIMRYIWRCAKTLVEDIQQNKIDVELLLCECQQFVTMFPPSSWTRRVKEHYVLGEEPLQLIWSILREIFNAIGEDVLEECPMTPTGTTDYVYNYLERLVECNKARNNKHGSTKTPRASSKVKQDMSSSTPVHSVPPPPPFVVFNATSSPTETHTINEQGAQTFEFDFTVPIPSKHNTGIAAGTQNFAEMFKKLIDLMDPKNRKASLQLLPKARKDEDPGDIHTADKVVHAITSLFLGKEPGKALRVLRDIYDNYPETNNFIIQQLGYFIVNRKTHMMRELTEISTTLLSESQANPRPKAVARSSTSTLPLRFKTANSTVSLSIDHPGQQHNIVTQNDIEIDKKSTSKDESVSLKLSNADTSTQRFTIKSDVGFGNISISISTNFGSAASHNANDDRNGNRDNGSVAMPTATTTVLVAESTPPRHHRVRPLAKGRLASIRPPSSEFSFSAALPGTIITHTHKTTGKRRAGSKNAIF